MNVLSLFDGMSCGRIALERAGIKVDNYYASEIDKYATKVSEANYPDIIRLGDVTKWKGWDLPKIDLLLGGSPCQGFSFAGKQLNFDDPRSKLFFEYVAVLKTLKPKYFLLENVRMKKEYRDVISEALGVEPISINSNLVSAQNRYRLYWTNIEGIEQPKDKGIMLKDIIETIAYDKPYYNETYVSNKPVLDSSDKYSMLRANAGSRTRGVGLCNQDFVDRDKSHCLDANYFKGGNLKSYFEKHRRQLVFMLTERRTEEAKQLRKEHRAKTGKDFSPRRAKELVPREDDKSNCLTTGITKEHIIVEGLTWRKLTPVECERLQTVPDNYTNHVSNSQRYKILGNGWTVDVIAHILKGIL